MSGVLGLHLFLAGSLSWQNPEFEADGIYYIAWGDCFFKSPRTATVNFKTTELMEISSNLRRCYWSLQTNAEVEEVEAYQPLKASLLTLVMCTHGVTLGAYTYTYHVYH